jgi:hypothetical protein
VINVVFRRVRELLITSGMVIGAFVVFVGVTTAIAYGSTNQSSETVQKISEYKTTTENSTENPDKAYLMIVSLAPWQASIMDSK